MNNEGNRHDKFVILTYTIIVVLIFIVYFLYQLNKQTQTKYSYFMDMDENVWQVNNGTGIGCVVEKKILTTDRIYTADFSTCYIYD